MISYHILCFHNGIVPRWANLSCTQLQLHVNAPENSLISFYLWTNLGFSRAGLQPTIDPQKAVMSQLRCLIFAHSRHQRAPLRPALRSIPPQPMQVNLHQHHFSAAFRLPRAQSGSFCSSDCSVTITRWQHPSRLSPFGCARHWQDIFGLAGTIFEHSDESAFPAQVCLCPSL